MSYTHLTPKERYFIYHMTMAGWSAARIGRTIGRHRGTIGRELRRNTTWWGHYLDDYAQGKAAHRRRQACRRRCTDDAALMTHVERKLQAKWSPEQIAGRLKMAPPTALVGKSISHATIYRWLWADPDRAERLRAHLRVAWRKRRKRYGKPSKRGQIPNRVPIDERPAVVNGRGRLGDWEGDTIFGKARTGCVVTNVDRASRYLVTRRLDRALAQAVEDGLYDAMRRMPPEKRKTETVDNGREFSRHEAIADRLGLEVYFAHAYSAWERGTNENTNGLLRQYLPKSRDFESLTDFELASYTWQLNNRPRKCLNYRTPAEVFHRRDVALQM
ncbi:MAG: IS30 family transposase [Planctomycetota bacterium]|jgi:IS30 family transposase